jgi:hypothetical protein
MRLLVRGFDADLRLHDLYIPGIGTVTSIFPCGSCINDPIHIGAEPIFTAFA